MIALCKIFLGYHMQLLQILPSSNLGGPPQPQVAKKKSGFSLLLGGKG